MTTGFDPYAKNNNVGIITSSTPQPMVGPIAVGTQRQNKSAKQTQATEADLIKQYGNMSTERRKALAVKLKAAGFRVPVTGSYNEKVRTAFVDANIALSDEITLLSEKDPSRLAQVPYNLDSYLDDIASTNLGGTPKIPSRSIYQYTPEQLGSKIDEVAQNLLGRAITDTDKQAKWYKDLNKTLNNMVMQGTVTTTKQVKNKKTGKLEQVIIQKPEVSAEGIQQTISGALTEADPISLERKKNLDFANWAFKKMGGGM